MHVYMGILKYRMLENIENIQRDRDTQTERQIEREAEGEREIAREMVRERERQTTEERE